MSFHLAHVRAFVEGALSCTDIAVDSGRIFFDTASDSSADIPAVSGGIDVFDASGLVCLPGLCDVHVHFREPGYTYKETIKSGSLAAAHGGFTTVCTMPNLNPVPDSYEHLRTELSAIKKDALVAIYPFGSITVGQKGEVCAELEELAPYVVGFSDDGFGVQRDDLMEEAMLRSKKLDKLICAHCEDTRYLNKRWSVHLGSASEKFNLIGNDPQAEWRQIERDLRLASKTGAAYHVCHVSTGKSLQLVREAKKAGINVSCETAPHYVGICDEQILNEGRFRMNPPIRSRMDREAILEGLADGTIDMIATDHAPHAAQEKFVPLACSCNGVVGLECSFGVLYTHAVKSGIISLERLIALMSTQPRKRFTLPTADLADGALANFAVFDLDEPYILDPSTFFSQGRATPFAGAELYGRCRMCVCDGRIVWTDLIAHPLQEGA